MALDGAPENERAIDDAIAVGGTDSAEYVLLRVVAPLHPWLRAVATEQTYQTDLVEERSTADAYLESVAERLRLRGVRSRAEVHVDANAAKSIVRVRCRTVGGFHRARHARGRVGRALLGSVADKVLRTASTPVLLHRSAQMPAGFEPSDTHLARRLRSAVRDSAGSSRLT